MCSAGQSMNRWSLEELVKRDPENFLILLQQIVIKTKEVRGQRANVIFKKNIDHWRVILTTAPTVFLSLPNVCRACVSSGSGAVSVWAGCSTRHHVLLYAASGTGCLHPDDMKPLNLSSPQVTQVTVCSSATPKRSISSLILTTIAYVWGNVVTKKKKTLQTLCFFSGYFTILSFFSWALRFCDKPII